MSWQIVTLVLGLWWPVLGAVCYRERTQQRKEAAERGLFGGVVGKNG